MYQLVFEIGRKAIELSRFRYNYYVLTHFSQQCPILNDCGFLSFFFEVFIHSLVCGSWKAGLGKVAEPSADTEEEVTHWSLVLALRKTIWRTLLRLKAITIHGLHLQGFCKESVEPSPGGPLVQLSTKCNTFHDMANIIVRPLREQSATSLSRQPIFYPRQTFSEEISQ